MKTNLKLFCLFSVCLITSIAFTSCLDDDGYSLNDMWGSVATVETDEQGYAHHFTLDNGQTMFVASSATSYKPKNERVSINYTILGDNYGGYDYAIKLNGYFEDILTKPIIYIPENDKILQDSIGYDPLKLFSVKAKAGYLTFSLGYNLGGGNKSHMLNLLSIDPDFIVGTDVIKLQLRHNAYKDPSNYPSRDMFVCFKLDKYLRTLPANQEKINFEITWLDYNGETKVQTVEYKVPSAPEEKPSEKV